MATAAQPRPVQRAELRDFPAEDVQSRWYAAYTCPRHEKRVAEQLEERHIEHFLPLYVTTHRWADRLKKVELPLLPGYVFVHMPLQNRLRVLQLPSVIRFVSFGSQPSPIPEPEIEILRKGLQSDGKAEPHPYLKTGGRVRVKAGPFQDAEGILVRRKNLVRVVLSVELIMRSVAVEVDIADVEPI